MEERKRLIAEIRAFLVKAAIMAVTLWVIFGVVFGVVPMKDQSMMPKLAAEISCCITVWIIRLETEK